MKRLINIGIFYFLFLAANVRADPLLNGQVSFDDITHLYTYTYTIDTTINANITELNILQNLAFNSTGPLPVSHTQPDGWNFVISLGGISEPGNDHILGSYWAWQNFSSAAAGDLLTFSFTTERGVNTTQANNYLMFDPFGTTGPTNFPGVIVGRVVGPEFVTLEEVPVTTVPENETYVMMIAGLTLIGVMAKHQKGRGKGRQTKFA